MAHPAGSESRSCSLRNLQAAPPARSRGRKPWVGPILSPLQNDNSIFFPMVSLALDQSFPCASLTPTAPKVLLNIIVLPSAGISSTRDQREPRDSSTGIVLFLVVLWHFLKHGKLSATATCRQNRIPSAGFRAWDWGWDKQEKPWSQSRLGGGFCLDLTPEDSDRAHPGMQG